ncbi:MAG: hypothetical protein EXR71_06725 [Myxococcales bacterium]|nr:hypothetical protein [Myxococcales bacterium]
MASVSGSAPKVGFKINHGPEATVLTTHTSIASVGVPTDNLFVFDASPAIIVGEYIQGVLVADGPDNGGCPPMTLC